MSLCDMVLDKNGKRQKKKKKKKKKNIKLILLSKQCVYIASKIEHCFAFCTKILCCSNNKKLLQNSKLSNTIYSFDQIIVILKPVVTLLS